MAVLRRPTEYNNDELVHGFGALSLVCLVVALVGIKLKWFKHRLTFNEERGDAFSVVASTSNEVYSATEGASSVYRSSAESSEPQIIRATFRRFDEMDVIPLAEPPPIRITNYRPPLRPRSRAPSPPPQPPPHPQRPEPLAAFVTNERTRLVSDTDVYQPLCVSTPSWISTADSPLSSISPEPKTTPIFDTVPTNSDPMYALASPQPHSIFTTVTPTSNTVEPKKDLKTNSIEKQHNADQTGIQQSNGSLEIVPTQRKDIHSTSTEDHRPGYEVGSISVDVLPTHKREIQFASTEDLCTDATFRSSTSSNHRAHLEPPNVPVPPNSPPPRPSILSKPIRFAELHYEANDDELHPDDLPKFECDQSHNHDTTVESIPICVPVKEPRTKNHPYTGHDHVKLEKTRNAAVDGITRTESTPNLLQHHVNNNRNLQPTRFVERKPGPAQSNPDLSNHVAKTSSITPTKSISSFFSFFTTKSLKDNTPSKIDDVVLPTIKQKTIRVPKVAKPPRKKLLNPLVEAPVQHVAPEPITAPLPVQRKKRQLRPAITEAIVDVPKEKPTSPGKSVRFAEEINASPPVARQRTVINVNNNNNTNNNNVENNNKGQSEPPSNGFLIFKGDVPGERCQDNADDDDESAWDLVAKHRQNNARFVATQANVLIKTDIADENIITTESVRTLELFNRPKTLREMQREQREKRERKQPNRNDREPHSDTEA